MNSRNSIEADEKAEVIDAPTDKVITTDVPGKPLTFADDVERDQYYYNIMNPDTGRRFDIPMLITTSPSYYYKYIEFMKLRERSPDTFEKVLSWD